MFSSQIHLMLNHISLIGIPISFILLLIGYVKHSDILKQVACVFFFGLSLMVVPTYLSGESSEEQIEQLSGISSQALERHEEASEISLAFALITGGFAGLTLLFWSFGIRKYILIGVAIVSITTTLSLGLTAHYGGQIRHKELNPSSNETLYRSTDTGDND